MRKPTGKWKSFSSFTTEYSSGLNGGLIKCAQTARPQVVVNLLIISALIEFNTTGKKRKKHDRLEAMNSTLCLLEVMKDALSLLFSYSDNVELYCLIYPAIVLKAHKDVEVAKTFLDNPKTYDATSNKNCGSFFLNFV